MRYIALCLWAGIAWAGVPQVNNDATPKGKPVTLHFKENLRFGAGNDDPHYVWSGEEVSLLVLDDGQMLVADNGGNRILVFDKNGKFVRQVGRQGKGPGEFLALKHVSLLSDGSLIALDQTQGSSSFNTFDRSLNFVKRDVISTENQAASKLMRGALISPNGKYIYGSYLEPGKYAIALLSRNLKVLYPLKNGATLPFVMDKVNQTDFWVEFLAAWLKVATKPGLAAFGPNNQVFVSQFGQYKITRLDGDLRENLIITKTYRPKSASPEVLFAYVEPVREAIAASFPPELAAKMNDQLLQKAIEKAELPARKDPIFGMIPTEEGGLLVVNDYNPLNGSSSADLFDKDGQLQGSFPLPKPSIIVGGSFLGEPVKMSFKNGMAYVLQRNEDDEFQVVRFSVQRK